MKRHIAGLFFFVFFLAQPLFSQLQPLKMQDVPRVMEKFLSLHITNKELSTALVRRSFKIYIEQFDPDRSYLLEKEITPYLSMSEPRAKEILERLKHHDYRDFIALNQLIQVSILRAENFRNEWVESFVERDGEISLSPSPVNPQFATTEQELKERQKNRMVRFYSFHKARSKLDTVDRKHKVFILFENKIRRIEYNYLFLTQEGSPLPQDRIEHLMALRILKAFAKSLDTHTSFFSPEEAYEMRLGLEKQFNGVGVIFSEGIDGIAVADVIQGSPAAKSGKIQVNDFLEDIDRFSVRAVSFEDVMERLKNKGREEIILGFKRVDPVTQKEFHYSVSLQKQPIVMSEERIQTAVVPYGSGIIGKIILHSFYENGDGSSSERDIKEAIRSFRQKGDLLGLVLDLRENSGGFLTQAVKVAGLFVSNGVIVISKYGQGEVHYLRNISGRSFFNGPLVVLTSQMSASAAEIVAQALQDYGVGLVVGDKRTFGKGSIQYQTVTDPNAEIFFKVTVGRYYTVSGRGTQINGVIADIEVPTPYAPYNIGEKFLEYPLASDRVSAAYVDPLSDLDERTKRIFQARYLPFLQRVVSFWKKMLPTLKQKSSERLAKDPNFQAFLKKINAVHSRSSSLPVNMVDEPVVIGIDDLQMQESVNIVKDMIQMEQEAQEVRSDKESLLETGS